jgi:lipopolysaccharide/colanic/teichoic acid biosynthesis glycosyltransferase
MLNAATKRFFDIILSLGGILVLSPFFVLIACLIKAESKGPVLFKQLRVGKNNSDFLLFKFRSMFVNTESKGQLTIGMRDPRITRIGYRLRKYKLDELPQLFNVLIGNMSFVGPRPEVRKYVVLYSDEQMKVLSVKPGITDNASIKYFRENEILGHATNPEEAYINEIMPEKLTINIAYVNNNNIFIDIKIIITTFIRYFY